MNIEQGMSKDGAPKARVFRANIMARSAAFLRYSCFTISDLLVLSKCHSGQGAMDLFHPAVNPEIVDMNSLISLIGI